MTTSSVNGHAIEVLAAEVRHERELRIAMEKLLDERDRTSKAAAEERDRTNKAAGAAALQAQKDQTSAAFSSSEKAIVKAEEAQKLYNAGHNDLIRKLDAQARDFVARPEFQAAEHRANEKIEEIKKELASLRESRSEGEGKDHSKAASHADSMVLRGLMVGVAIAILGNGVTIVLFLMRTP